MKKIFFAMPSGRFDQIFPAPVLDRLKSGYSVAETPIPDAADPGFVAENIGDSEIAITSWNSPMFTESLLSKAPNLEFIAHAAGSIRPVVSDAVWDRGIQVTSGAKAIADGVAEFCLGLTLTCTKRAFWFAEEIRNGGWSKDHDVFGPAFEIFRQKIGVIGAGYTGRRFIELLAPFGCEIVLFDPYCSEEDARKLGATKAANLEEIFAQCRVVSLHAPTTEETKGMIRGSHFARLQTGSLFINTARGVIVRQDEMVEELEKGRFIACLDVTDPEPPPLDDPLRRLPNVLLTPHEAGTVRENRRRIGEFIADEIDAFSTGKPLLGEVTKERLELMA